MADINKTDVTLVASQRLDDTTYGGGQMTSIEVISGSVNNLYPDISRLDRVYGRVSLRKAYLRINTDSRATYYGSHAAITRNAADDHVSVCFFSSKSWFDTREEARQRIEAYLVKGPFFPVALWGNHYRGARQIQVHAHKAQTPPEIGDVIVLMMNAGLSNEISQYLRITTVSSEIVEFSSGTSLYQKKIITIGLGNMLLEDYIGEEIFWEGAGTQYGSSSQNTMVYTTVAADASRYYGVASLAENATTGQLQFRVNSINVPLVPSAQSQTAITDAGVGQAVTPMLQTNNAIVSVTRSISFTISANSKLYIGEGILPGTFHWTGGLTLTDNSKGDIENNGTIVGSIAYDTGICVFTNVTGSTSGTGTISYVPACSPTEVASTGAIQIDINNRGFVFVFNCNPLPKRGTVKIDYLANGKWYSIWDKGNGSISGSDQSIGSGSVNALTGSISMTLGAMPDVGSMILIFWAKDAPYYDLSGETLPVRYEFTTQNTGIAKNSFSCSWNTNAAAVKDDGSGNLTVATWSGSAWVKSATVVGTIHYASGKVSFGIGPAQEVPSAIGNFNVSYMYGDKHTESFNPGRESDGSVLMELTNLPVEPGTFTIEWHTNQEEYAAHENTTVRAHIDPTWTFQDNTTGGFKNEKGGGGTNWFDSTIDYTTGIVHMMPDRLGTFPFPVYTWSVFFSQGVIPSDPFQMVMQNSYTFDHIAYAPAASMWPTDGIITVTYCSLSGSTTDDYSIAIPRKFFIKEDSNLEIVPGSVDIMATVGATTYYMMDIGSGKLFRDVVGTTGVGTECGTVNYVERSVTITDNSIANRNVVVKSCAGTAAVDPVNTIVFRAPAAPIVPQSLGIRATLGNGNIISGQSDFNGEIIGTGVNGIVNFDTGICVVSFGAWVTDTYAALPIEDRPDWYAGSVIDGANVWKPYSVRASTVLMNCVVTSYLPLDSELLGLDPVRLPMDGKVPIFRDGYIVLVHHTLQENLANPVTLGTTYNLSRGDVDLIELYDSTGKYYPEIDNVINYTVDLDNGSVTIAPTAVTVGYDQPFYAIHRIEDMCLASDVQITGHIAITNALTHNYPKDETLVSSILPSGDLQGRCYNEFVQSSWTSVWSDDLIGSVPLANYDFVNFPVTVTNIGATKERWLLKFTSSSTFDVVGEHLGVVLSGATIPTGGVPVPTPPATGTTSGWFDNLNGTYSLIIKNRLTAENYLSIDSRGFGVGWASGNSIRLNTDAANYPYWFVRTTLQAPPTEATDDFIFQIRGDSA